MEHLQQKFLKECVGNIELILRSLNGLKAGDPATQSLRDLHRGAHSIKGGAGFFDLERLGEVAGAMEAAGNCLLAGTLAMSRDVSVVLQEAVQCLTDFTEAAEVGIVLVPGFEAATLARLEALCQSKRLNAWTSKSGN